MLYMYTYVRAVDAGSVGDRFVGDPDDYYVAMLEQREYVKRLGPVAATANHWTTWVELDDEEDDATGEVR